MAGQLLALAHDAGQAAILHRDGTVLAACFLRESGAAHTEREGRGQVKEAIDRVARELGNTPTIARTCYVHPDVIEAHMDGSLLRLHLHPGDEPPHASTGLRDEEKAVLRLLERGRSTTRSAAKAG